MKIRKLEKNDISKISELYKKEMDIHFKKIGEKPISREEYEKRLKESFNRDYIFILEEERIVGFLWFSEDKYEINIEEIFAIEKNKGYGKKLMDFLLNFAKKEKIKRVNLDVHLKNKKAIDFFKKFGFSGRTVEMSLDLD